MGSSQLRNVKISQLRNLLAVANAGTVRQASRDLSLSQLANTKSINALEEELDSELFRRESHGVTPTASGRALIRNAKLIEAQLNQVQAAERHRQAQGPASSCQRPH